MPDIDLERSHELGIKRARAVVDKVAVSMQKKFGMSSQWDGDVLRFARSGVEGSIEVAKDRVRVQARLGLMLGLMKATIADEIRRQLDAHFG